MKEYIKSPLNYTGNKYNLLEYIVCKIPLETKKMLDLFSGGATVGINSGVEEVIFIDKNTQLINLLQFFQNREESYIMSNLEKEIENFGLTNSYKNTYKYYREQIDFEVENKNSGLRALNKEGFLRLREEYNKIEDKNTDRANILLYLLILYGFNNDLRFNSKGEFNLPVGKTDFNINNVKKLSKYLNHIKGKKFNYINTNFDDDKIMDIINEVDFIYMDPPYLITNAFYNENDGWTEKDEIKLLELLDKLIENKKYFILSNVLSKGDKYNIHLKNWIEKNESKINIDYLEVNYRSASYNKKDRETKEIEVLINNII